MIRRLFVPCAIAAAVLLLASAPAVAQGTAKRPGLMVAERTDAGKWLGTWYHNSRDFRMALWLRTVDDVPQVKLQYLSIIDAESFQTEWDGTSSYRTAKGDGTFTLELTEADADTIRGGWNWLFDSGQGRVRRDVARFELYRTGDGRSLVMRFLGMERVLQKGDQQSLMRSTPAWAFRKASRRLVLWDELPF